MLHKIVTFAGDRILKAAEFSTHSMPSKGAFVGGLSGCGPPLCVVKVLRFLPPHLVHETLWAARTATCLSSGGQAPGVIESSSPVAISTGKAGSLLLFLLVSGLSSSTCIVCSVTSSEIRKRRAGELS
eukprot:CAMPEP_0206485872 /NCGR_PEP_ID=MMETSP0324_2-20121206/40744_1 /ASSEMBLY_ACC=CAM_ASM_000836 /TAXON_ID=2866 /ORGANISM="Crypthecodinium cohnii, Strain Seligo" /LENGTH=127 /DNA_ID=CAMNT_0053964125 /DNA_START=660 /DNA_END=1041 /DNA_ORIENTATION=+